MKVFTSFTDRRKKSSLLLITCTQSEAGTAPLGGTANPLLPTFGGQLKRAEFTRMPNTYTMSSKVCAFSREEMRLSSRGDIISRVSKK